MDDLTGKVALVTGASRGIGKAAAIALAEAGCDIVVNYRASDDHARAVATEIESRGRRALLVKADVSVAAEVSAMVATIERELGTVSILVNNAGIARKQSLEEITEADWDEIIDVNLKSAFLVTQAVVPGMRKQRWGRIMNLSSTAAQVGGMVGPHYSTSKAGLIGLAHSYACILAKEGITANAIAPALIETDLIVKDLKALPTMIPAGRYGHIDEVGEVIVMLARNGFISGQTININGGWYMSS